MCESGVGGGGKGQVKNINLEKAQHDISAYAA